MELIIDQTFIYFRVAKNFVPSSWNDTLKVVEEAANRKGVRTEWTSRTNVETSNVPDTEQFCNYECDTNKDGRSFSYNT